MNLKILIMTLYLSYCFCVGAENLNDIYIISGMSGNANSYQRLNNKNSTLFSYSYSNGYRYYYQAYSGISYSKLLGNKVHFYSKSGTMLGWTTHQGNRKYFYRASGELLGWATQDNNKTNFYLADGSMNGWSTYSNSKMMYFDKSGRYLGYVADK
jgi:dTDP-4-dehydrorhamnose 3,5-epimerase-like enzyme